MEHATVSYYDVPVVDAVLPRLLTVLGWGTFVFQFSKQ